MMHMYKHIEEESILSAKIILDTKCLISSLLVIGKYGVIEQSTLNSLV